MPDSGPSDARIPANLDGMQGPSSHFCIQVPTCQGQGAIPAGVWGGQDTQVLVLVILSTGGGLLGISLLHSEPRVPHLYQGWFILVEPFT